MIRNTECTNNIPTIPNAKRQSKPMGYQIPSITTNYSDSIRSHDPASQQSNSSFLVNKDILTSQEAADYLGISKRTLYKYNSNRQIPSYVPFGKKCYYKGSELDECVLRNKRKAAFRPKKLSFSLLNFNVETHVKKVN